MSWLRLSWPYVTLWLAMGALWALGQALLLYFLVTRPLVTILTRLEAMR